MLKNEIEINQFKKNKKNQLAISFEISDSDYEPETNPIESKL